MGVLLGPAEKFEGGLVKGSNSLLEVVEDLEAGPPAVAVTHAIRSCRRLRWNMVCHASACLVTLGSNLWLCQKGSALASSLEMNLLGVMGWSCRECRACRLVWKILGRHDRL